MNGLIPREPYGNEIGKWGKPDAVFLCKEPFRWMHWAQRGFDHKQFYRDCMGVIIELDVPRKMIQQEIHDCDGIEDPELVDFLCTKTILPQMIRGVMLEAKAGSYIYVKVRRS
jgi:hypothetical protein